MARGFTPIIGLAVVVALALAAVFGAMSLSTNPAFAADGFEITVTTAPGAATITVPTLVDGATNYRARHRAAEESWPAYSGNGSVLTADSNTLSVPSLTNNVEYEFEVEAITLDPATRVAVSKRVKATPKAPPTAAPTALKATGGAGTIKLEWSYTQGTVAATGFQYAAATANIAEGDWKTIEGSDGSTRSHTVTGLDAAANYVANVRALNGDSTGTAATQVTDISVGSAPTFKGDSDGPGSGTSYTVAFTAPDNGTGGSDEEVVNTRQVDLVIEFQGDFTVPASISNTSVAVTTSKGDTTPRTFTPEAVTVNGNEIFISLHDMDETDAVDYKIEEGEKVSVLFRQSAGIKNPTEGGDYGGVVAIKFGGAADVDNGDEDIASLNHTVIRKISLDPEDGGRSETVTLTGKGFKDKTTLMFIILPNADSDTSTNVTGAQSLCVATVGADDIGTCTVTVTSPLFTAGDNYINARDGRNNMAKKHASFEVTAAIDPTPAMAGVGDSIQVQLYDFKSGSSVSEVKIGRQTLWEHTGTMPNMLASAMPEATDDGKNYQKWTPDGSTSVTGGELNFKLVIPDNSPLGVQDLQVITDKDEKANKNITITGPTVTSNPTSVLANQRISLVGNGFNRGSTLKSISFAGDPISPAGINGGQPVTVDNGGGWSASVDLPLGNSTVSAGTHKIQVEDTGGRIGATEVTVPGRTVDITPRIGRVGTLAVVRGENFPSKNDDGESFSIEIIYESANGKSTTTAVSNASGSFETEIRIPTTATIPSTNVIRVSFDVTGGTAVVTTLTHDVPEGAITLSTTSGPSGSTVSVSGEGFKSFVPVSIVKVGSIEVTPSPRPSTDAQGMMSFDITVPGLDVGIQTVEVKVGQTTAGAGFTVTPSGVTAGDITPAAEAVENLGDSFGVAWHFNNDTKSWTFYDGMEGSDLMNFITGESYLVQVTATTEAILNNKTRSLTCVGGNCWNQIVW